MPTHTEPASIETAIRDTRLARRQTLRDFAAELGVSYNAVFLWEKDGDVGGDRIAAWITDPRDWVREMGVKVFAIKHGPTLAQLAVRQSLSANEGVPANAQA